MSKEKEQDKKDMDLLESRPLVKKETLIEKFSVNWLLSKIKKAPSDTHAMFAIMEFREYVYDVSKSKQPTITDEEIAIRLINKIAKHKGLSPDKVGLKINGGALLTVYYGLDK